MYELSRVRLFSVGPPGARYQDVWLDLRGVGAPVEVAAQPDLFAADDRDGVPRRPSPASVLYLENGGGKSVLLKLIFSVLLPGRRQVVGTSNTRVLEKFVLAEDIAHVALEWMHTVTGERLVTGKASEWRGHAVSTDPAKLSDAWYSFHPRPGFGIDELPFTVDRRRVTLAGFKERLEESLRADPGRGPVWETVHREWSRHLIELGLDPELFRYQRAMNAGEGEAAEAFSFPSDEAFVDFLLRAVTDPEEPQGVAEVVAGYAAKIAQRAELELEREFVEGTLARLEPLDAAERQAALAAERETIARQSAQQLAGSLLARSEIEQGRLELTRTALREAGEATQHAVAEQRRLQSVCTELRRLVATLNCQACEDTRDTLAARRDEAGELVEAWRAVEPTLRDQIAAAEAARLRRVVEVEQERARPALAARQAAATALARALRAIIDEALEAAAAAERHAATSAGQAQDARARQVRHSAEAERHRAGVEQAHTELGRIKTMLAAAVGDGVLAQGDDVTEAAEGARLAQTAATAEVEDTFARLAELRGTRRTADARLARARAAAAAARNRAEATEQRRREADHQHDRLAGEPRLAELLGADTVHPDQDLTALLDRLAASVVALDEERTRLREAQQRDQRTLRALGEGGLLPEPAEVEQVLGILEGAGVAACSGWRHLSRLPEADRVGLLERAPQLLAGVLLNDPADASRAREALAEARPLPRAVILVGSTLGLPAPPGPVAEAGSEIEPGIDFVVEPNPAMYDAAAADQARTELVERTRRGRPRLAEIDAALERDRTLTERLRGWRAGYPVGALAELAGTAATAATDAGTADETVATEAAAVEELERRSEELDQQLPRLRAAESAARDRATRLARLSDDTRRRTQLAEEVMQHTAAATAADAAAKRALADAEQAQQDGQEQLRAHDRNNGVVAGARDNLAELPTDTDPSSALPEPPLPLSVLRTEYRKAEASYAAAEVDADLRSTLHAAEREAESTRAALDAFPDPIRARADTLLRRPDGADASSRRAATAQAARELREVDTRLRAADTDLVLARRELDEHRPQQVSLVGYGAPESVEHGTELIERAERERRAADQTAFAATRHQETTSAHARAVELSATGFSRLIESLDEPVPAEEAARIPAIDGDLDTAAERWKTVRHALREAGAAREAALVQVRRAADEVAHHAQDARFGTIGSLVRRHILGVSRAEMPALAGEWAAALRPRLRSLRDDLGNIGRHRSGIVTRLSGMVGEALRTLRLAQRLSQLPEGLSDWSGQQFLRIRFEEIDDDTVLAERLGEVVDRTAEGYLQGGKDQRDGMALLLRGVRAAMPRGVRVEMLKPDAVLRTERLRVSEVRDVFSGGQQLTAAIVLYCTMAALRAHQRGEGRRPHAGVLFLDNPIGRASAGYLLELQFGVARALGVQLIYTTGLFDAGALSTFPLIIRLRNDADLRAGRKYLSIDDQIARRIDELPDEDGSAHLAALRIFRRPEPAHSRP